jgi:hypothetical protein
MKIASTTLFYFLVSNNRKRTTNLENEQLERPLYPVISVDLTLIDFQLFQKVFVVCGRMKFGFVS